MDINIQEGGTTPEHSLNPEPLSFVEPVIVDGIVTVEPVVGIGFESLEDAYHNYNRYAKVIGFSVRKRSSRKSRKDGSVIQGVFCCSKEGKKRPNDSVQHKKGDTRTGCKAFVQLSLEEKHQWVVKKFDKLHNHDLLTPSKTHCLRSQRKVRRVTKNLTNSLLGAEVKPNQVVNILTENHGGLWNLPFTNKDCRNVNTHERASNLQGGDAQSALTVLSNMQQQNPMFFYTIELDNESRMKSLFWVHGRSRFDYKIFGDVVCVDSTYRTNIYGMLFTPFVGVNHHNQTILFGAALLTDETTSTYEWVFRKWLEAMNGKQPKAIITDQDLAMKAAISTVFPKSVHRYCSWHIMKKLKEKLSIEQSDKFHTVIHQSKTKKEFDDSWDRLVQEYKKQDNEWLQGLFREREHWVPIYVKGVFFAGMSSTQRSESINSFFDGFVDTRKSLGEFVERYDDAYQNCIYAEVQEDVNTINKNLPVKTKWPLEMHGCEVYTNNIFKEFQKEIELRCSFYVANKHVKDGLEIMEVKSFENDSDFETVTLQRENIEMSCTCKYFEFKGLLCRHILRMMENYGFREIPAKYILERWTRCAKKNYEDFDSKYGQVKGVDDGALLRRLQLSRLANKIVDEGCKTETSTEQAVTMLEEALQILVQKNIGYEEKGKGKEFTLKETNIIQVSDPLFCRSKGRPSSQHRFKSPIEKPQIKRRQCCQCGEFGHNMRSCKKSKMSLDEVDNDDNNIEEDSK